MSTSLLLLGTSFRSATAADREAVALDATAVSRCLEALHRRRPGLGAVLLATCNRTELYLSGADAEDALAEVPVLFGLGLEPDPVTRVPAGWYRRDGEAAARHLLRVTCGLESSILGDVHVPAQVRAARDLADAAGMLDPALSRLAANALQVGRRVRRSTDIAAGAPGIGPAIIDIIDSRIGSDAGRPLAVVVVGAGKVATSVVSQLATRPGAEIVVVNRHLARAQALAAERGGRAVEWSELPDVLHHADVVVATTSATRPVLDRGLLAAVRAARKDDLLVVDAGFPRNAETVPGVDVVPLEEIGGYEGALAARRRAAVPAAELLIDRAVEELVGASDPDEVEELIKALYLDVAFVSRDVATSLERLDDRAEVEHLVRRSLKRMLHPYVHQLRTVNVTSNKAVSR